MSTDCNDRCPLPCDDVFVRVRVRPAIQHGTVVEWLLDPYFNDPQPHEYQLQVGDTGLDEADDWVDVGLPAVNAAVLLDDEQRDFGATRFAHYRIKLTTPRGVYYSVAQHAWGDLPFRDWRKVLARERTWRLQFLAGKGERGFLLKRKLTGETPEPGQGVIDYITQEIVNPQAAETLGTEFLGGYYEPLPCVYADRSPLAREEKLDDGENRGSVNDLLVVKATMLATPQVDSFDVWVDEDTDLRWQIYDIQHVEEIRGVPIVISCTMKLLPFSDIVYAKEMPILDTAA